MSKTRNDDLDLVAIGQRMKLIRARLRKTQAMMANDLGVSLSHYSKLEVGIGGMSHGLIYTFCSLFDVSQEWFCYGTGEDPNPIDPAKETNQAPQNVNSIDDNLLEKIITLTLDEDTSKLAEQIATATHIPNVRALSILIREKLQTELEAKKGK